MKPQLLQETVADGLRRRDAMGTRQAYTCGLSGAIKNSQTDIYSVFWLYCWGKTGMNIERVRQSMRVFDNIFPVSFAQFDAVVDHELARRWRYADFGAEHRMRHQYSEQQNFREGHSPPHGE